MKNSRNNLRVPGIEPRAILSRGSCDTRHTIKANPASVTLVKDHLATLSAAVMGSDTGLVDSFGG